MKNNYLCAYANALTPVLLQKVIVLSGLTWGVPSAQYFAMQTWGLMFPESGVTVNTSADSVKLKLQSNNDTLLGLPLQMDDSLPSSIVQLRYQGAVLFEIQNLAVPLHFE